MSEETVVGGAGKLKLNLFHMRKGEPVEALDAYYTIGRKPAGGLVARVVIPEDVHLKKHDTLVFDFTIEKA
jgi:hypothetical protein